MKGFLNLILKFCALALGTVIFLLQVGIYLIFYGPLTELKELYVTTAMTTMNHKYLAYIFVSGNEIDRIMKKNKIQDTDERTDQQLISKDENIENKLDRYIREAPPQVDEIRLLDISTNMYKGHVIIINNPALIHIGSTGKLNNRGMALKQLLEKYNSKCGINAGGFADEGGVGTGGTPSGILIENGEILYADDSYKYNLIGLNKKNVLILGRFTLEEIQSMNIRDATSFRPFLIINGNPQIKYGNGGWGIAPRTAIGQTRNGSLIFLAIDGRQADSIGATLKDVQDIMLKYGAINAANLDGGASTTMYYDGKLVNKPCSKGGERYLPSAFIIY